MNSDKCYKLTLELRAMHALLAQIDIARCHAPAYRHTLDHIYDEVLFECVKIEQEYMRALYEGVPC